VRGVDVDSDGQAPWTGMEIRGHRAERFAENHIRAAVQEADRLGVALHRHGGDAALDRELGELDAHPLRQRAHSAFHDPLQSWCQGRVAHVSSSARVRRPR
jgi:hypothetical protein